MSGEDTLLGPYFAGEQLWGDDFVGADLEAWLDDEREGYAQLAGSGVEYAEGPYGFEGFNRWYGFRHLPETWSGRVLGVGAATGDELVPVIGRATAIDIIEPSLDLRASHIGAIRPTYHDPEPSGALSFDNASFDLVTCFGVLHHIANVSAVVAELGRVTAPGGYLLLREPVISMGDWRRPRPGLTRRERGIPRHLLDEMLAAAGFDVERASWCDFPTTRRLAEIRPGLGYGSRAGAAADQILARATAWNYRYHALKPWQKIRPIGCFYVAVRSARPAAPLMSV